MMSHIVDSCSLSKLNGSLSQLHSADDEAVAWLISMHMQEERCAETCFHMCLKKTSHFVNGSNFVKPNRFSKLLIAKKHIKFATKAV